MVERVFTLREALEGKFLETLYPEQVKCPIKAGLSHLRISHERDSNFELMGQGNFYIDRERRRLGKRKETSTFSFTSGVSQSQGKGNAVSKKDDREGLQT